MIGEYSPLRGGDMPHRPRQPDNARQRQITVKVVICGVSAVMGVRLGIREGSVVVNSRGDGDKGQRYGPVVCFDDLVSLVHNSNP